MSRGVFMSKMPVIIVCFQLAGILVCSAQTRPRGRPIEFSEPKSAQGVTNLSQLGDPSKLPPEIDKGMLNQPSLNPVTSFEVMFDPPKTWINRKQVQDYINRKKNWVFMEPGE